MCPTIYNTQIISYKIAHCTRCSRQLMFKVSRKNSLIFTLCFRKEQKQCNVANDGGDIDDFNGDDDECDNAY